MKKVMKLCGFLLIAVLAFGFYSCDNDPAESDLFLGTYKGKISYAKLGDKVIGPTDGKVVVGKVGKTYSFHFTEGIPDITGLKFEEKGSHSWAALSINGLSGIITINDKKLHIAATQNGATWTADCTRE